VDQVSRRHRGHLDRGALRSPSLPVPNAKSRIGGMSSGIAISHRRDGEGGGVGAGYTSAVVLGMIALNARRRKATYGCTEAGRT
jgi:hypothetical protein